MEIAVTGSSGLIGTALLAALRRAGHRAIPVVRPDERVRGRRHPLGSRSRPDRRRELRGARRGRAPRRDRDRRPPLDSRAEAPRPREPHRTDDTPGRDTGGTRQAARCLRVGIGDRLVREPRRGGPHRGEPAAERARLPRPTSARSGRQLLLRRSRPGSGPCICAPASCSQRRVACSSACCCRSASGSVVASEPVAST